MVNSGRIIATLLAAFAPFALLAGKAAEPKKATEADSHFHRHVRQLLPVAYWSFKDGQADLGEVEGDVAFDREGPTQEESLPLGPVNSAAGFDGGKKPGVIIVEDVGPGSQFDFDNGDPITIEAWVNPNADLQNGSTMYVLGKGRTGNPGRQAHNQNYGFRIFRSGDSVLLSFLFRSRTVGAHKSDWHRWDSKEGFALGSGWHHIAVTYQFGIPQSIRGYVDGRPVKGGWNPGYAGATEHPPIVDDDDVWVGSSMGRSRGASFRGKLDEVALYRRILTEEQLGQRYPIEPYTPKYDEGDFKEGHVRVEIVENLGKTGSWPRKFAKPSLVYDEDRFAFFQVPEKYVETGVRGAWTNPFLLRAAAYLTIAPGDHEWLLRVRGKGRLWIDDQVIAEIDFGRFGGGAHNDVGDNVVVQGDHLRYLGPGDREKLVKVTGDGKRHLVVLEMIAGNGSVRSTIGETSLSVQGADGRYWLLGPSEHQVRLEDEDWNRFRHERTRYYDRLNRSRRMALRQKENDYWDWRHERARAEIAALTSTESAASDLSGVDAILESSWKRSNEEASATVGGIDFAKQIKPILAENCYRCHDKKSKGGLRLSLRDAALAGGESDQPAIVPGKPHESYLLDVIDPDREGSMPPQGDPLSQQERELLAQWIREGATYRESNQPIVAGKTIDDLDFLRRATLDTVGVVPSPSEIRRYLGQPAESRRANAIERLLADDRWADHWTSYWQDVLAENPNILKPSLNNSGPFRFWIHEALLDNLPVDRFVTELIMMKGDAKAGGPAGFAMAAQNDVPMAAKAHILGTAFLGVEMKCARCHDAPYHESRQQDLFQLAAMLRRDPINLPRSSSVPATTFEGREPLIEITLEPATTIDPGWPKPFAQHFLPEVDSELLRDPVDTRERLAAMITSPRNPRFAEVIVNRLWQQLMGAGFVEPVNDWEAYTPSHPELLRWLSHELLRSGYDQKHIVRLILNSRAYQRRAVASDASSSREFASPVRRRMKAEQIVDSLFAVAGLPLDSEELTMDNDGTQRDQAMISLGYPRRAWEFTSLSNERDRPSLAIPKAQAIVDVLENFGWRASRQEPQSNRDRSANVRQPAILANGSLGVWVTTLSEGHAVTKLATNEELSLADLIDETFLRVLTRKPTADEAKLYAELLRDGFDQRVIPVSARPPVVRRPSLQHVSWSNHLSEEANRIKIELEKRARQGDPPTVALEPSWRQRMEDMLWALMNSPEFIYLP